MTSAVSSRKSVGVIRRVRRWLLERLLTDEVSMWSLHREMPLIFQAMSRNRAAAIQLELLSARIVDAVPKTENSMVGTVAGVMNEIVDTDRALSWFITTAYDKMPSAFECSPVSNWRFQRRSPLMERMARVYAIDLEPQLERFLDAKDED
jgi:hypothetical protein